MARQIAASDAKNNFGGLLEEVAAHGRVDITKHGRVVAVVLAPRLVEAQLGTTTEAEQWGKAHMIPPRRARAARMVRPPEGFDDP
jgi:prevent-host-death family protein